MLGLRSKPFARLVSGLKRQGQTCTVVESCCGGLISTSIMAEPGSSAVYYGGSVAYNTKKAQKLLLSDVKLHETLLHPINPQAGESEGDVYIRSKLKWTKESAIEFCKQMNVDYAIAEGGAAGPTFRPVGMNSGFAVIAIAGRDNAGNVELLAQKVIHSSHSNREQNMRFFADAAAELAHDTIIVDSKKKEKEASSDMDTDLRTESQNEIYLDRATVLRSDETAIWDLERRSDAKHVVLCGVTNECLFASTNQLALVGNEYVPDGVRKTFLGLCQNQSPLFSIDVDATYIPPPNARFLPTRTHAPLLSKSHNELALYATALSTWARTHSYCSQCGSPLMPIHGGTALKCTNPNCNCMSWPRQDPSIIVLITNRDQTKALLARSSRHPPKLHTAIAGFVEAGETFEKAVMRESQEETGIMVDSDSITYLASQPWPFPRSTMIAFRATADDSIPLNVDFNELEGASWFDKNDVAKAASLSGPMLQENIAREALQKDPSLQVLIPPKGVVARSLIDNWLEDL